MTTPPLPARPESFSDFLKQLEDGVLHAELTEQLRGLVAAMHDQHQNHGGKPKGKLGLTLTIELEGGIFEVVGQVKVQPPNPIRTRSLCYRTPDNRLTANNPKQLELGVEARDVTTAGVRELRVPR